MNPLCAKAGPTVIPFKSMLTSKPTNITQVRPPDYSSLKKEQPLADAKLHYIAVNSPGD